MGILVELASCQFQSIFLRAGCPLYNGMILSAPVEWGYWWNWHLASFMLIFLGAGCPLYNGMILSAPVEWG
ncbi:hypothetical protein, partial [Moorena sp. SIO4A1]